MATVTTALWIGSLLPLAAVATFRARLPGAWLVASAFAVSFAGDLMSEVMGGAWEASYLWLPVQMGLVLAVLLESRSALRSWLLALGACMAWDVLVQQAGPDMLVTVLGSSVVVALAYLYRPPFRLALLLYFGLGSACYLAMVQAVGGSAFALWWWAYQSARVLAWVAFAGTVVAAYRRARQPAPARRTNRPVEFRVITRRPAGGEL